METEHIIFSLIIASIMALIARVTTRDSVLAVISFVGILLGGVIYWVFFK